ncbi:MAG: DUF1538 domain-containing protein [Firmicutes bacterium]|nr:DUF1538 domain-containing protein [Bacillota bacterium]
MNRVKEVFKEVCYAMVPLSLVVIFLQLILLKLPGEVFLQFLIGVIMVGGGLFLFLIGGQVALLPMGELIGSELPKRGNLWVVLFFGLLLGFAVTLAEPHVRVLALQVDMVSQGVVSQSMLIYAVASGVGIFLSMALLRILFRVSIIYLLIAGYILIFLIASFSSPEFVPVSFDAGGVITGPLVVPFLLSLGVGVSSTLGGKSSTADRFGLVALSSVGPVLAILLLGVFYR